MLLILIYKNTFDSTFDAASCEARAAVAVILYKLPLISHDEIFLIEYCLRELFNNAVEHGNKLKPEQTASFEIRFESPYVEIDVYDQGNGFDINKEINKNKDSSSLSELSERKRGLLSLENMGFSLDSKNSSVFAKFKIKNISNNKESGEVMEIDFQENVAVCKPKNCVVAPKIKEFVEKIRKEIDSHEEKIDTIVLDLSKVESIDSMGITFLIGVYKNYSSQGKKVTVQGVHKDILRLFKIMKLDEFFSIES